MPELKDVLDQTSSQTDSGTSVVDVTTIDDDSKKPETNTTTTENSTDDSGKTGEKTAAKKPAAKKTVAKKPAPKTQAKKSTTKPPAKKPTTKTETETTDNSNEDNNNDEPALRRPPMEQLTKDFERYVATLKIGDKLIKKLGYKCGKIIYGLENANGKDFRVIAFKARKKTKTVAGKSRCIFYFGISKETNNIIKQHAGTSSTEFGSCSVQAKKPIQLVLDKVTFSEVYEQNIEKVMSTLKSLCSITIEQKTEQWKSLQEKIEAKKKAATAEKKPSKKKTATTADAE